jgi:hypothetical protein
MKTSANILGIRDLLVHSQHKLDTKLRIKAADNALLPITLGIGAIGGLMAVVDHDKGLADGVLEDAGWLLAFLAELVNGLNDIKDVAIHEQAGEEMVS